MNLLHLRYFRQLAHNGNLTKTAQELYISQPALSKTIRQMEEELGVEVFDRRGKKLTLNAYGESWLKHVECALDELEDGKNDLKRMKKEEKENVSFLFNRKFEKINEIVLVYWKEHPNVKVSYNQGKVEDAIEKLLSGEIDFAFVNQKVSHPQIEARCISEHEVYAYLGSGHPLANQGEISLIDLKDTKFICNEYSYGKEALIRLCCRYQFVPQIAFTTSDADMIRSVMAAEPYCFLARSNVVQHVFSLETPPKGTFHYLREHIRSEDYILRRNDLIFSEEKQKFLAYILQELRDYDVQTHQFAEEILQSQ